MFNFFTKYIQRPVLDFTEKTNISSQKECWFKGGNQTKVLEQFEFLMALEDELSSMTVSKQLYWCREKEYS